MAKQPIYANDKDYLFPLNSYDKEVPTGWCKENLTGFGDEADITNER